MNKSKHTDVQFCTLDKAIKLINDPRFVSLEECEDDCFEVSFQLIRCILQHDTCILLEVMSSPKFLYDYYNIIRFISNI